MARRGGHPGRPTRTVRRLTIRLAITAGLVISLWVGYALVSALWFGSSARTVGPYVYAPVLVVVGLWAGRRLAVTTRPRLIAVTVAAVALAMVLGVLLTDKPGKLPIGYPNANAALAVQLMAFAGLVGLHERARSVARVAMTAALVSVLANRSAAGAAVALPVLLATMSAHRARHGRHRWPVAVLCITALTATTTVLVILSRRAAWPQAALIAFDETRRFLWLQGWEAFRRAELLGQGPGGYERLNKLTDPDQTSAHSLPIHVAVELGAVGLALLVALYLVGLAVALRAASPARSWIVATAWTALAVHSFVDHLVEYWPVMLGAGLVLGYGLVAQPPSEGKDETVELASTRSSGS